jgi:LacI family transcriptional regulator
VSRALNKPGRINSDTEAKIRAAAKELNYRANPMARSLPTGRTHMVAVIVADITNPMNFDAIRGAEFSAARSGYTTVIAESQESGRLEATALERIMPSVDGVILASSRLNDDEIAALAETKPLVVVNRRVDGVADVVPHVEPGIAAAIEHLKNLGHEHVAFIEGPAGAWMSNHRWNIILSQAVGAGLTVVKIGPNEPTFEAGRNSFDLVRASGATAVIAYNDLLAIGFMKAAQANGVSVPGLVSVIGFDDIFASEITTPSLTSIKSPLLDSATIAVERLLATIDGKNPDQSVPSSLYTTLVVRESSGPARKG